MSIIKPMKDNVFLQELQSSYFVNYINNSEKDVKALISGLTFFEAPDYINGYHYVERFTVDAYERVSIKPNKRTSLHRADGDAMGKRANTSQDLFHVARYTTPDNRTSTQHLKKNVRDMIDQKTKKIAFYDAKYPRVVYRHLLIEVGCHCFVYTDEDGNYYSKVVPTDNLHLAEYEIYRDENFINELKSSFSEYWDLLLFVNRFSNNGDTIYYVSCIDLKRDIICGNMISYPERIFQRIEGALVCHKIGGGKKAINIRYSCTDDAARRILQSNPPQHIEISGTHFTKDKTHDSIYSTDDNSLSFELSQLAFAISENLDSTTITKCEQFLQEKLFLVFNDKQIILTKHGVADGCTFSVFI